MTVRELGAQDVSRMAEIVEACKIMMNLKAELNWDAASLRDALVRGRAIGAFIEGDMQAFILFVNALGSFADCIEIWCLATHPQFQGCGLMGRLIREVQSMTSEVWLEVHKSNSRAIEFYKNKGFQEVGIRVRYYQDGSDAYLFSWLSKRD